MQSHRNSTGKVRRPLDLEIISVVKPPPPSGPPPQSAIDAGIRARSRQNSSNMFGLGQTVAYISDDSDDFESDDEDYKKEVNKTPTRSSADSATPNRHEKVKTTKNIRKEGQKVRNFALKSVALTVRTQAKRTVVTIVKVAARQLIYQMIAT